MSENPNGSPMYIVTAARLGAWQRYQQECNGKDISPQEFLPLQGRDIYTKASNGVAQALRNLTSSGETKTDTLYDDNGNQYDFFIRQNVPLGSSLLQATSIFKDVPVNVPGNEDQLTTATARVLAKIHGKDEMGPIMMQVHDSQNIEDLLESAELRVILALAQDSTRVRYFHLGGRSKTIVNIKGKQAQHWRLYSLEIHDQYTYPELQHHAISEVNDYLANPYNAQVSMAAAKKAFTG